MTSKRTYPHGAGVFLSLLRTLTVPVVVIVTCTLAAASGRAAANSVILSARGGSTAAHAAGSDAAPPLGVTDLGAGAWCWFDGAHAVVENGVTFVGYLSPTGAVTVVAARRRVLRTAVIAHLLPADDHAAPDLIVLPDGRLVAFYSQHTGRYLYWRVTLRPADISGWTPAQTLWTNRIGPWGDTYTYPEPVWLWGERRAYLFWRGGDKLPDFSTGATLTGPWRKAESLIRVGNNRPYLRLVTDGQRRIMFAYTTAHPREGISSLYFAEYSDGMIRHADGRPIAPLARAPIPAESGDLIWNARTSHLQSWVWDTAIGRDGRPVITFVVFRGSEHEYHWVRWTGSRWEDHVLANGGGTITTDPTERWYSAGVVLDHRDPEIVYASVPLHGHFEIARYVTADGGWHWSRQWITHTDADNVRPYVPEGTPSGHEELLWLHGTYGTYRGFHTRIWGIGL